MDVKKYWNLDNFKFGLRLVGIALLASIFISIIFFEIGTRLLQCPSPDLSIQPPCYKTPPPEISTTELSRLKFLREKGRNGEKISKEEYQKVFSSLLIEVNREAMPNIDGISCGDYGYIRNDLPEKAKLFVTRHEGEHMLLEDIDLQGENEEFISTWAAWRSYPLGGLQAMIFGFRNHDWENNQGITICSFMNSWTTFKQYYLP